MKEVDNHPISVGLPRSSKVQANRASSYSFLKGSGVIEKLFGLQRTTNIDLFMNSPIPFLNDFESITWNNRQRKEP